MMNGRAPRMRRASASITPSHFEQVPNQLLAKIVETSSKAPART
jgi:elongation factor G